MTQTAHDHVPQSSSCPAFAPPRFSRLRGLPCAGRAFCAFANLQTLPVGPRSARTRVACAECLQTERGPDGLTG